MAAVELLNLPKIELQTPHEVPKAEHTDVGRKRKLSGKTGLYIIATLSVTVGLGFTILGLTQSNGCTAGMFVNK